MEIWSNVSLLMAHLLWKWVGHKLCVTNSHLNGKKARVSWLARKKKHACFWFGPEQAIPSSVRCRPYILARDKIIIKISNGNTLINHLNQAKLKFLLSFSLARTAGPLHQNFTQNIWGIKTISIATILSILISR